MDQLFNNFKSSLQTFLNDTLYRVVVAILFLLVFFLLYTLISKGLKKVLYRKKKPTLLVKFIATALKCGAVFFGILIAADILGIPNASIIALLSTAALAVGLTLQGVASNLMSGVIMLNGSLFKEGDYIALEGVEGSVLSITITHVEIVTSSGLRVTIPNSKVTSDIVTNYTVLGKRRIAMDVSVSYDSDMDRVAEVLRAMIERHPNVMKEEEQLVRIKEHGDSAVIFVVRCWTPTDQYWSTYYDFKEQILSDFKENGIEIPYPHIVTIPAPAKQD